MAQEFQRLTGQVSEIEKLKAKEQQTQESIATFKTALNQLVKQNEATANRSQLTLEEIEQRVASANDAAAKQELLQQRLSKLKDAQTRIEREHEELETQQEEWEVNWKEMLSELSFDASWSPQIAQRMVGGLRDAKAKLTESFSLDQRIADMEAGIDQFEHEVQTFCTRFAVDLVSEVAEQAVGELNQRLQSARKSAHQHETLLELQREKRERCQTLKSRLETVSQRKRELFDRAEASTVAEFQDAAQRAKDAEELHAKIREWQKEIDFHRGDLTWEAFTQQLQALDPAELDLQLQELIENCAEAEQAYQQARESVGMYKGRLDQINGNTRATQFAVELESHRAELASLIDRWAPLVLANRLMTLSIERFEREQQPEMLQNVAELFSKMTDGRYKDLRRKLDEVGTLMVIEESGRIKEPHQLSTGTREQLYLAIRLAYMKHYCQNSEPLPVVMDDVLVNFDEKRTQQSLKVLRDCLPNLQIIFLTCHQSTVKLAKKVFTGLVPIELERNRLFA